jgi:hypothetical protein
VGTGRWGVALTCAMIRSIAKVRRPKKTGRRSVLLAVAGWALAPLAALARLPLAASGAPNLDVQLLARLVAFFGEPGSAAALGAAYLRQAPEEADAGRLVTRLFPGASSAALERWSDGALRSALAQRLAEDFAHSRTVILQGWVLSRSEARLFAAAALAQGAAAGV